jgi:hypothetical protein
MICLLHSPQRAAPLPASHEEGQSKGTIGTAAQSFMKSRNARIKRACKHFLREKRRFRSSGSYGSTNRIIIHDLNNILFCVVDM